MRFVKTVFIVLFFPIMTVTADSGSDAPESAAPPPPRVKVLFTPDDDCIQAIVGELNGARKTIRMQAGVLSCEPIGSALIAARRRGVDVQVLLGDSEAAAADGEVGRLQGGGVTVRVDRCPEKARHNVIVIDLATVITGSFRFSDVESKTYADDLLIIKHNQDLARRYLSRFATRANESPAPTTSGMTAVVDNGVVGGKSDDEMVWVTEFGKRYHRAGCRHVPEGAKKLTRAEAVAGGKTPCKVCKPDVVNDQRPMARPATRPAASQPG